MIITYLRSSSYGCHSMCEMKYFIEYNLGWSGPPNIKAEKGTVVHKVLEVLAIIKLNQQNNVDIFEDEIVGKIDCNNYDLDDIIDKCTQYYKKHSTNKWKHTGLDEKHCKQWVYKALEYDGGEFDPRKAHIIQPEQSFDITIDRDWAKYEYVMPDGREISGNLAIKGTIDQISKIDDNTYQILDWKGLPIETPLPTPNGWTTMGEIKVGDCVFDKNGKPTIVTGKSQRKFLPCYRITFDDKTTVECDNEHLWSLEDGSTVKITDLKIGDKIPVSKTLQITEKELPIDPYLLGVWLGDGRNRSCEITSKDTFIFDEIEKRGYRLGKNQEKRNDCETRTIKNITSEFRKLNLLNNKHIPDIYLRASENQRLDLLRGLMDTDGNANPTRKQAVFTTCSKRLSDDVKELLLSLGQRVNQSDITRSTNFSDEVSIYPLAFRPIKLQPFLLPRKADQIDLTWGSGNSHRRLVTKIELIEEKTTQCIMVDSPTSTYLCTKNMIPTHNTGRRLDWATGEEKTYKKLCNDPQLMMYYYAIQHLYPEIDNFQLVIYFINDGGPFTLFFGKHQLPEIERIIREKFETIKESDFPILKKTWKCTKFCHFGRTSFENTSVLPIIEKRPHQITPVGEPMTKCEQVKYCIEKRGMDSVVKNMSKEGFDIDYYKAPGEVQK